MSDPPPLLSACLVVRDEEVNLARAIGSLQGLADEVVVYDTGSVDRTVGLARELGAVVIEASWPGDFAAARNSAMQNCRGAWVLSLDGDEELRCEDPATVLGALRQAPEALLAFQLSIDNAVGTGSSAGYAHVAERLFRRGVCRWRGRLHEQLVERESGELASSAYLGSARIAHHGYLATEIDRKDKVRRNLRLARADVDAPSLGDRGIALVALGRALWAAEQEEEALAALRQGAVETANATARRQGLTAAARLALQLGRLDLAAESVADLRTASRSPVAADVLQAGIELSCDRPKAALELLATLHETVRDDDGYEHGPDSVAEWRAAGLVRTGRPAEAAELLLDGIARGLLPRELDLVLEALEAAGRPLDDLVACLPEGALQTVVGAGLRLEAPRGGRLLEVLWRAHRRSGNEQVVLVGGALWGRLHGGSIAQRWSRRLEVRGLGALCPLRGRLSDVALPPAERIAAARLLPARVNGDPEVRAQLEAAVAALDGPSLEELATRERTGVLAVAVAAARAHTQPPGRSGPVAGARPEVSLVILARGGATAVAEALQSLAVTLPETVDFEVVIVDPGTTDGTAAVLAAVGGDVTVVRIDVAVGSARARNVGASFARAPLVVFVDTAARPQVGWLEPLLAAAHRESRLGIVVPALVDQVGVARGGGLRLRRRPARRPPALGLAERPWGDATGEEVTVEWLRPEPKLRGPSLTVPFASGPVLAVRAKALAACGGFDEGYWNGGEEVDLCAALRRLGAIVVCEPNSTVATSQLDASELPWALAAKHNDDPIGRQARAAVARGNCDRFLGRWSGLLERDPGDGPGSCAPGPSGIPPRTPARPL